MKNKSVIIYGPPRCGKSHNAEIFRKHYKLDIISEGLKYDVYGDLQLTPFGVLYLTNDIPSGFEHDRRVIKYKDAIKAAEKCECSLKDVLIVAGVIYAIIILLLSLVISLTMTGSSYSAERARRDCKKPILVADMVGPVIPIACQLQKLWNVRVVE